jgi:predicted transcriptional regulator
VATTPTEVDTEIQAATTGIVLNETWAKSVPSKIKTAVAQYVHYRARGIESKKEIAERMGLSYKTLQLYVSQACKAGWLTFTDPMERIENEIIPRTLDNITHFLDAKSEKMTIEAAKGTGLFKSYQSVKVDGDMPQTVLALRIETADPSKTTVLSGKIVGTPKQLED